VDGKMDVEVAWRFSKVRQDDGFARLRRRRG
jgi:hypothetical protein